MLPPTRAWPHPWRPALIFLATVALLDLGAGPAGAASASLRLTHPRATRFKVYVSQPNQTGYQLSTYLRDGAGPDAGGGYTVDVPIGDPDAPAHMMVAAFEPDGRESPPSQVRTISVAQFCGVGCRDGVECTADLCDSGGSCINPPNPRRCNDDNPCTDDACDVASGCFHTTVVGACDDGRPCTVDDVCFAGECAGSVDCPGGADCDLSTGQCEAPPGCGDGVVQGGEVCDDGEPGWHVGEKCRSDCTLVSCGDPDDSGRITAIDAFLVLRGAVGIGACDQSVCNVDGTGDRASVVDSLRVLQVAIGHSLELACPGAAGTVSAAGTADTASR